MQSWWQGSSIVSGKLANDLGGGIWKNRNRFMPHLTSDLLRDLASVGIRQPASYGSCYHTLAKTPRVPRTINNIFSWWPGGPWQEALFTGRHFGRYYRYDLCSAYRWAATVGLPDMATVKVWEGYRNPRDVHGLWVVTLNIHDLVRLPSLFRRTSPVVMSSEDMQLYDVTPEVVHRGVVWDTMLPGNYVEQTLAMLPCPKEVGRAYWGRWIARDRLECKSKQRNWFLPNVATNFVWGWLIVSRVRGRVWSVSQRAIHVYVDEVIIPHTIDTGDSIGDWKLKESYDGLQVFATGWYGTIDGSTIMHTGSARSLTNANDRRNPNSVVIQ